MPTERYIEESFALLISRSVEYRLDDWKLPRAMQQDTAVLAESSFF
jgi:hypothetical protein